VATNADGEALGLEPDVLDALLGTDGEAPVALEIAGDRYTRYVTNDAGRAEVGDVGTTSYDDGGRSVAVSEGGCAGCTVAYEWSYDDGTLTRPFTSAVDDWTST
jgi:hypothetical protein